MAEHRNFNIRISSSADQLDLNREDEIDVLIAYGNIRKGAGVKTHPLGTEEIAALCSPDFAAANKDIDEAGFADLVRLESTFSPVRWSDWAQHNGMKMTMSQTGPAFDRGSMVIAAAVQGVGLALETVRFAQSELNAGSLVRFGGGRFRSIERELHFLCYRTRDETVPKVRRFCDWILSESGV